MRLAEIDSPALEEGAVAAAVAAELRQLGWDVSNDGSGPQAGNLLARRPHSAGVASPVLVATHLDVVEPCRQVRPRLSNGAIESDGTTVLGADDKAGVAAVLEAARVLHDADRGDLAAGLELLFTWGEEVGHRGARAFDRSTTAAPYGFVLDALLPVGSIVVAAPTYVAYRAHIRGRAAHAGVEPERGVSAIAVAARAIEALSWGRLDEITTSNIGTIAGGSARNVVAEYAEVVGEIRSLDPDRIAVRGQAIVDGFQAAADALGAEVETRLEQIYTGYQLAENAPSVQHARRAYAALGGGVAVLAATGGGSDANEFNRAGLECCVLGIGAEACHSVRERMAVEELGRLADWVLAIADR
jgi:tripeptide aminopeptidase